MKALNFEQAQLLIGRKGVTVYDQDNNPITSWVSFFKATSYHTQEANLGVLNRKYALV